MTEKGSRMTETFRYISLLWVIVFGLMTLTLTGCGTEETEEQYNDGLSVTDSNSVRADKIRSYGDSLDGVWTGTIDEDKTVSVELRGGQIYGTVEESDYSDAASPISQEEIIGSYYFSDDNTLVTDLNITDDGELICSETEVALKQPAENIDNFSIVFNERTKGDSSSAEITDAASGEESDVFGDVNIAYKENDLDDGYLVTEDLRIRAVINTVEKGPIEAVWQRGGGGRTSGGHQVIWGYFYASPDDVSWGSKANPDLFVKIWFDAGGRTDVNFFHVSVPDIEVFSDYPYNGIWDERGATTMTRRYIRQYYENGQSDMEDQNENGNHPPGYHLPDGNPSGYAAINDLAIGAVIKTEEAGMIEAVWKKGGSSITEGGHQVLWGYFYASPEIVNWGSENNPDLFVKVWFDASGRIDVNFFHVSVPNIEVYSDFPGDGIYDETGTTVLSNRYIRHEYQRR